MQAKDKKKLRLSSETVRQLNDREVLNVAVGGATRRCTGTELCTDTCSTPSCLC